MCYTVGGYTLVTFTEGGAQILGILTACERSGRKSKEEGEISENITTY